MRTVILLFFVVTTCAFSATISINHLGTGDYPTIQDAIDAAEPNDVIVLALGTYTGDGNRDIDFLGKAITVRSTDPTDPNIAANTVINCEGAIDDRHRGVFFHSNETPDSVLSRVTITNGFGIDDIMSFPPCGGAIACQASSPTISYCIIRNNEAQLGGGVFCFADSYPLIINCEIAENVAGGGGGVFVYVDSCPIVVSCVIRGNTADGYGGGVRVNGAGSSIELYSCLIIGNSAIDDYGGIDSRPFSTIINCTISNNHSDGNYGAGGLDSGSIIKNCIVRGNTAGGLWPNNMRYWETQITYSNIQGGVGGTGNIDADPYFANPAAGDYRLVYPSPCLDAGDPAYTPDPNEYDVAGNPRVVGVIDMGAYEGRIDEPYIWAVPSQLSFWAYQDRSNPADQVFSITNGGVATLNWQITEDSPWLSIDSALGSCDQGQSQDVTVSIDITGLTVGNYTHDLAISDPNAYNSPQVLPVHLEVIGPSIQLSTTSMNFNASVVGPNPDDQVLQISNSGGDTLNWQIAESCSWLSVLPTSGSITTGSSTVTVSIDTAGLTAGLYTYDLYVNDPDATNNPQQVSVELDLLGPIITLSETTMTFDADFEGPNPDDQVFHISNSGVGTLNWQITEDCPWLSVAPTLGSITDGDDVVTVSIDKTGMDRGVYSYDLYVTDPNAYNGPQQMQIVLINGCYTGPDYDEWVLVGRPASWCYPRQCHGEADNAMEIIGKCMTWVGYNDIDILNAGFKRAYPGCGSVPGPAPADPDTTHPWIAADFNHAAEQIGKDWYRVGYDDIAVLNISFKNDAANPPDCNP